MKTTRRDFAKLAVSALPASAVLFASRLSAAPNSKIDGVQVGTITYSFKQDVKKPEEILPDLVKIGLSSVELMSDDCERMAGAEPIPNFGFGVKPTPEQQALVNEGQRKREAWRRGTTASTFERVRKMFDDAGVHLDLLCYNMRSNITDEEIEHAFRMAQALR